LESVVSLIFRHNKWIINFLNRLFIIEWGDKIRIKFIEDKRGIEGLPMRLIIIVVIAVVIIAALVTMMKYVTVDKPMTASCVEIQQNGDTRVEAGEGFVVKVDYSGMDAISNIKFKAKISVKDNDGKPVSGADVIIDGAHAVGSGKTGGDGNVTISIENAKLEENQGEAYMKITVKAKGYRDFKDEEGLLIKRVT